MWPPRPTASQPAQLKVPVVGSHDSAREGPTPVPPMTSDMPVGHKGGGVAGPRRTWVSSVGEDAAGRVPDLRRAEAAVEPVPADHEDTAIWQHGRAVASPCHAQRTRRAGRSGGRIPQFGARQDVALGPIHAADHEDTAIVQERGGVADPATR